MKNIISFDEFVNESLLLESFQSLVLADFKANFKGTGDFATKLPKGILWDQIPDSEIIGKDDPRFNKKTIGKDDSYVVFWYNSKKQLVKWKQPTYTSYGAKRENSIYLREDVLLMTRGLNFLYGYGELMTYKPSENRYEKPADGALAVSRLYDELECAAFAIKWDTLQQYSSANLRYSRKEAKAGALALMKASDILYANQRRYQQLIKTAQLNRDTKPVADRVVKVTDLLKSQIEKASQISFGEMVTFSTSKYNKDGAMQSAYINKIDYSKVEELVGAYNDITYAFNSWIDDYQRWINDKSDSYKKWADVLLKRLEDILAKY